MKFPKDFRWGVATSAFQIEGSTRSDGRTDSIWDQFIRNPGRIQDNSTADIACDHYNLYKNDIQLMQELGIRHYSLSFGWPRILPAGYGKPNQKGLDFYSRLIDCLLEHSITPCVTLNHWDLPQVLQDKGGWANRDTAFAFSEYAYAAGKHFHDRIKLWITHKEPLVIAYLGYKLGCFAPGITDWKQTLAAIHHMLVSHGLAAAVLHKECGRNSKVGISCNLCYCYPASDNPQDLQAAARFNAFHNAWYLDPLAGKGYPQELSSYFGDLMPQILPDDYKTIAYPMDFLGINYYESITAQNAVELDLPQVRLVQPPQQERTQDRRVDVEGFDLLLEAIQNRYHFKEYMITEIGAAYPDTVSLDGKIHDHSRIHFLQRHLTPIRNALSRGMPITGCYIWSLMDNFEWIAGYSRRYGIVYVDFPTQKRIPKDSARWYSAWIQQCAISE